MGDVRVPRGFLVIPSSQAEAQESSSLYVPFFLRVRSEDILWDSDMGDTSGAMSDRINALDQGVVREILEIVPETAYRATKNDWAIQVESDGLCTMTKQIPIAGNGFSIVDESNQTISARINFPATLLNNAFFNVQVTLYGSNATLQESTVSFDTPLKTRWMYNVQTFFGYSSMNVTIHSTNHEFPDIFDTTFTDGGISITVRGMLPQG